MKRIVWVLTGVGVALAALVSMAVVLERGSPAPIASISKDAVRGAPTAAASAAGPATGDAVRIAMSDFVPLEADRRVLVIDVRVDSTYRDGHIPGAVNIGTEAVKDRASEILALAAGRPIVTYCSCVNEHSSAVAAVRLTEAGAPDVRALVGGYPAWVSLGGPVAKGDGSGE